MGTLKIEFIGICTHIKDQSITGAAHRCVLVNGTVAQKFDSGSPPTIVPPHYPRLVVKPEDIAGTSAINLPVPAPGSPVSWPLGGIRLHVANAIIDQPMTYSENYGHCMFRLGHLNPGISDLSAEVVRQRQPDLAACYFDVNGGAFDVARTAPGDKGALFAILTVQTDGDPVLEAIPFIYAGGTVTLHDGATITVLNTEFTQNTANTDFLLHYRVVQTVPANPFIPDKLCPGLPPTEDIERLGIVNIGPGCSNSNYP